jgi:hypothetical protein
MTILEWTALYVAQAVFWVWLAREAARDRPRGDPEHERSLAASLWRYDSSVTRWASWTFLCLSTVVFILGLVALIEDARR